MIIPWVKIKWISNEKGYGLVASRTISKGTITFVQDGLDIVIPENKFKKVDPRLLKYVEKYSYEDYLGNHIISWDLAKYMNHDNEANTLTTGYGFEIAVRDVNKGEELTDDYRIFSTHHDTRFINEKLKLNELKPWPDSLIYEWDQKIRQSLLCVTDVDQPLMSFIKPKLWRNLLKLQNNPSLYTSVSESLPPPYKVQKQVLTVVGD